MKHHIASATLAFRGGSLYSRAFWNKLLPTVRAGLVVKGLFTKDGKITDLGLRKLQEIEAAK